MRPSIVPLMPIALIACFVDQASAQAQPGPAGPAVIGSCVVIQTAATPVEIPIGLRAAGSCETAEGGAGLCTAQIVPTGPDIVLDVTDNLGQPQCLRLAGDDPCVFVQNGPVIFQSDRQATQSFSAGSHRVRMTAMIRQKRLQQTIADLPAGPKFALHAGQLFDVMRSKSSVAARLECTMANGDQRILPIVGESNPSPNIVFVSKNSADPMLDILTYRVTQ
jgi:hypothetical protein